MLIDSLVRTPVDEFADVIQYLKKKKIIAPIIDERKALVMANYFECIWDTSHKMPKGNYKIFELIEDMGMKKLQIGTPGGGYHGYYRMFKIDAGETANFVGLGLNKYSKNRTIVCVALQKNGKKPHHSLQLAIDDYMLIKKDECIFKHRGHIGLGSIGAGYNRILREDYVAKVYPQIISGDEFLIGKLPINQLWYLNEDTVRDFTENLISYSIARDMYRDDANRAVAVEK